jgi:hypothetical protein
MVHRTREIASAPIGQASAESASPKHTPTPWRLLRQTTMVREISDDDGIIQIAETAGTRKDANAAMIVKAVNSHAALVKALQAVIDAAGDYLPPDGISKDDFINRVLFATDNSEFNAAFTAAAC